MTVATFNIERRVHRSREPSAHLERSGITCIKLPDPVSRALKATENLSWENDTYTGRHQKQCKDRSPELQQLLPCAVRPT